MFARDAWTSQTRTPALYPDAVTLVPDLLAVDLLARVDPSAGCSIKDSFASLDLQPFGFRVLFDAEWIARPPRPAARPAMKWEVVRDAAAFAGWEEAWRSHGDPPDLLRATLLDHESVTVVASREEGRVVTGAVLNESSTVVGISNFFAVSGSDASTAWAGCVALASSLFPSSTLVGYEVGATPGGERSDGFEAVGPLRVWLRDG